MKTAKSFPKSRLSWTLGQTALALLCVIFAPVLAAQSAAPGASNPPPPRASAASLAQMVASEDENLPELSPDPLEAEALFQLARRVEAGDALMARNEVLARRLYRIAGEAGHLGAQCNYGAMLMDGAGGPSDLIGGAAWFRRAALRGHPLAQYNLGVMHALGDGVVKDAAEALAWIEQSISRLEAGDARNLALAWREMLRTRLVPRDGIVARARIQELSDAIARASVADDPLLNRSARISKAAINEASGAAPDQPGEPASQVKTRRVDRAEIAVQGGPSSQQGLRQPGHGAASGAGSLSRAKQQAMQAAVKSAVSAWLRAWSARQVESYLAFYDDAFELPAGLSRNAWIQQRTDLFRRTSSISVRADHLVVNPLSATEAQVQFKQVYFSRPGRLQLTAKTMRWRSSATGWRIVSESVVSPLSQELPNGAAQSVVAASPKEQALARAEAIAVAESPANQDAVAQPASPAGTPPTISIASPASSGAAGPMPATAPVIQAQPKPAAPSSALSGAESDKSPTRPELVPAQAPARPGVETAVAAWVRAWSGRRAEEYLQFYAPRFVPEAGDRGSWQKERRDAITKPAWLVVRADQLKTSGANDEVEVKFLQVHVTPPHRVELGRKTMRWIWLDGRWQILEEKLEPLPVRSVAKPKNPPARASSR
jgi:TPR repeat protein